MSAVTVRVSPTIRFTAWRPSSTAGATRSITIGRRAGFLARGPPGTALPPPTTSPARPRPAGGPAPSPAIPQVRLLVLEPPAQPRRALGDGGGGARLRIEDH